MDEDGDEDREEDASLKVVPPSLSLHVTLLAPLHGCASVPGSWLALWLLSWC